MREVLPQLQEWAQREDPVALATVIATARSSPRPVGAKMLITRDGEIAGAISGGCVESVVFEAAREILDGAPPTTLGFGPSDDGWTVGLPCGGEIEVFVERLAGAAPLAAARLADRGGRGVLITVISGPTHVGAKLLIDADGDRTGSLGTADLDDLGTQLGEELMWCERSQVTDCAEHRLFFDLIAPLPRLLIFGAVDCAAALCTLARGCGWRPYVIDPRSRFAARERFPSAEDVIAAWPADAVAHIGGIDPATAVAILTHDPKLDDAALAVALHSDAGYVGAMGSRHAQAQRSERLRAAGYTDDQLARIAGPIGLDLGASTPEETALSILAEITAVRHGRAGGRLCERQGRIHPALT